MELFDSPINIPITENRKRKIICAHQLQLLRFGTQLMEFRKDGNSLMYYRSTIELALGEIHKKILNSKIEYENKNNSQEPDVDIDFR